MRRTAPALALGLSALLVAPLPAQATTGRHTSATTLGYGTKATYAPRQDARTYQSAPRGFVPVFTENVSRHGSRSATDAADGDLILALWDRASSEGQLTSRGREFGPRVRALEAAMAKIGYGNLSGRGKREMRDTATRLVKRLPGLFRRIARDPADAGRIDVVSSGQGRAVDSGTTFAAALGDAAPGVEPLIGPTRTDKNLLYFHKSSGGAAYQTWLANDQRLADTLKGIKDQPATARAATNVLKKIFKPAFVQRIEAGEFASTGSAVDAAEAVYNLYAIAPAMSEESPGGRGWGMDRYLSRSDAAWFGYLGDAEDFYEKGPSFADGDITYRMADVLLDDFFARAEAERDGTSELGAELRFTHAEEIIPLAALMGLPGSTKGAAAGRPYTYADNPWRGADVAPLGANIQWDVFRKGSTYLVRMLYNEKETAFKAGCRPVSRHSAFYDLDELERCFGRKA
ncbi:histidine-type phosphatase [Streptomyces sp. NPDC002324]